MLIYSPNHLCIFAVTAWVRVSYPSYINLNLLHGQPFPSLNQEFVSEHFLQLDELGLDKCNHCLSAASPVTVNGDGTGHPLSLV